MKCCYANWEVFLVYFTEICIFVSALAIFFGAPESWGRIEPIMIGHYTKKNSSDNSELPHIVDIECFLYKPYPAVIQVWYIYL
jgi:hypothetical protein